MDEKGDIGVIGLAVMGQNLILNMNDHGFKVVAYNRTIQKVDDFLNSNTNIKNVIGAYSIKDMIDKLKKPRKIVLLVRAGMVIDEWIEKLIPYLNKKDLIIDAGNSNFIDTENRIKKLEKLNIYFIGAGISGGEEGARFGPSMMPGGMKDSWHLIKNIFQTISAKTTNGDSCCEWVGSGGAGHFVKMVHNGIEYADMQLICEIYHFIKLKLQLNNEQISEIFMNWNNSELNSYLIEITAKILKFKDSEGYVLDRILDISGQKGTGKWTVINALNAGVPLNLIAESVFARCISTQKNNRVKAENTYGKHNYSKISISKTIIQDLQHSLLFAKIISYTQGFMLMKEASDQYSFKLKYGNIALIWREGCIIRSIFLEKIKNAFDKNKDLNNLLFDSYFKKCINKSLPSVRKILVESIKSSIPMPALTSAISFFDSFTTSLLPANLLQAQRDYFGAHTYQRLDKSLDKNFHTDWIQSHQKISSTKYDV